MNISLILSIVQSLMFARWKQTLVAAVGVTFSITMFIALLSFMMGLNDLLDGLVINRTPHIRLYNEIKASIKQPIYFSNAYRNYYPFIHSIKSGNYRQELYNSNAIEETLKKDNRIIGFSPKITAQLFFNNINTNITGVVTGIDVDSDILYYHFNEYIIEGAAIDISKVPNSIILGKGLATKLLANIGDMIQVTTVTGEHFALKVVGYFQLGLQEFDKTQSFASLATVQKLLGKTSNYITDLQIKLKDINEAPTIAKEYAQLFGTDAEDIQTANAQFETGSFVRTLISYAVGITLLIVAGFGIYNILNMMIYDKMDTIAILKATGFSGKDIKIIFLTIALSIGFFGGIVGLLFGFLLSVLIDQIPFNTPSLPTIKTYPINYSIIFYIIGISFSLITTYFAGLLPSRKASKIDPVGIIRGK
jgi:lipoprotein-releasing system permease protein